MASTLKRARAFFSRFVSPRWISPLRFRFQLREQFLRELGNTFHRNEVVHEALILNDDLHERGVRGFFHISMLLVNLSVAFFRLFDGFPTCFARDLGARLRSGEVAEEAVSKGLVVVGHQDRVAGAG